MRKGLFIAIFFSFILFSQEKVFAEKVSTPEPMDYTKGLLDDAYFLDNINHDIPKVIIDNDIGNYTDSDIGGYKGKSTLSSEIPFDITGIYIMGTGAFDTNFVTFLFSDGTKQSYNRVNNGYNEINKENIIQIDFTWPNGYNTTRISELELFGSYEKTKYSPLKIKSTEVSERTVDFTFDLPDEFDHMDVLLNSEKVESVKENKYNAEGLEPDTEYEFKFITYYKDGSVGKTVTKTIKTKKEQLQEVTDVEIKPTHERINLSWSLPEFSSFQHVNIYRDEIQKVSAVSEFFLGSPAYAASTKIFETNGTYFNDLTVKPQTTYEYTLTTTDGTQESEGVTVQATTPKAPIDEVGGVDSEEQENGDYLFKWASPTKGDVQIYVGGKKYKKVPASDGKILIPKADLKFNAFGDPDVTLQAIDEDGEEGAIISPGGSLEAPFNPTDLIKSSNGLMVLIAPILLLGLSFLIVPKFIRLINQSNNNERNGRAEQTRETRPSREGREYRRERTT